MQYITVYVVWITKPVNSLPVSQKKMFLVFHALMFMILSWNICSKLQLGNNFNALTMKSHCIDFILTSASLSPENIQCGQGLKYN